MLFNSVEFLIFFTIVYSLYLILNFKWQNRMLLVASYVFYGFWDWRFLSLIIFSTIVDYCCGLYIAETDDVKKKKKLLLISIFMNLALLGFFKYFNFFAGSLIKLFSLFGVSLKLQYLNVILPVGISFYTFQTLSYTFDIYKGQLKPTKKFFDFALFVAFFPQLVAGPIERAKCLLPQILEPRSVTLNKFYEGCFLVFWGLFEKIFISGNLAKIVDPVFVSGEHKGSEVMVALYAFAFQILCDFDGYSNIARGLGKVMGFELMINFNLPYFATNPSDFWKRWHISLSTWLKDYLYIPLGGNKVSNLITYRNLAITMLLGGLWHGAAWTFVVWGAYQGILLMAHRKVSSIRIFDFLKNRFFIVKLFVFFHLVVLGWLFFRAQNMAQVMRMLHSIVFSLDLDGNTLVLFQRFLLVVLPLLIVQIGQYKKNDLMFLFHGHWFIKTFAYALMTYLILGYGVLTAEEFIYFQF
ncbi:MAG: acyltransferase [Omnitrophica WOR_2 bacterium GWF2_38_59]|nr:MAG: acyltransferase [Omnitrophica WOR_2 bacterium GWF2_38_59]OGX51085.1 MAG: acyltransferase [Omnitrophica WOR_2 bacterium RIFOXYA2_FULL_38_17]OGX54132.1 MAG: acyltransferase [Omnitrophica WOR_2 bacterium RIFOXYA12_FULL_38_10]OGX56155.1 MAG: acyltransferase [Omnitrophica WOR_2 bacterium RIFOXYC2_FULL_38_12]OGX60409.1 MAG: acyltransferase [Omnitrophica WOR_2 bacterium RIFOXYB2_FULL_38_16]HBG60919.1 membrane-bound O-acyltransferase family protein [Candidatus Omnitrophota bacterium]